MSDSILCSECGQEATLFAAHLKCSNFFHGCCTHCFMQRPIPCIANCVYRIRFMDIVKRDRVRDHLVSIRLNTPSTADAAEGARHRRP